MKYVKLQAAENTRNTIHAARIAGMQARTSGAAFNAKQYGAGTLESQAFAAGWRERHYAIIG